MRDDCVGDPPGEFIFIANNYNFYKKSVVFSSYFVGSMGAYWVISRFINLFY